MLCTSLCLCCSWRHPILWFGARSQPRACRWRKAKELAGDTDTQKQVGIEQPNMWRAISAHVEPCARTTQPIHFQCTPQSHISPAFSVTSNGQESCIGKLDVIIPTTLGLNLLHILCSINFVHLCLFRSSFFSSLFPKEQTYKSSKPFIVFWQQQFLLAGTDLLCCSSHWLCFHGPADCTGCKDSSCMQHAASFSYSRQTRNLQFWNPFV